MMNMLKKYAGEITSFLIAILLVVIAFKIWTHHPTQSTWMSDIAKKDDPAYAGKSTGYVILSMTCYDPQAEMKARMGQTPVTYAYGKFDVDLKTGKFRMIEYAVAPDTFKCPTTSPVPLPPANGGGMNTTPPPTSLPPATNKQGAPPPPAVMNPQAR